MTHRFFVAPQSVSGDRVEFSSEQRNQLRNVLRLGPGDKVTALDGSGREFLVELATLDERLASGRILSVAAPDTEPRTELTLIQAMPKGEKLELILQKCTEIGVSEFLIVETSRSVPRIPQERIPARLDRWRSIVREAAEQSGRTRMPIVAGVIPFREAVARARDCDVRVIAREGGSTDPLITESPPAGQIALVIGPEGGFSEEEIAAAADAGFEPVSLGHTTLRTETAAIVGAALILIR